MATRWSWRKANPGRPARVGVVCGRLASGVVGGGRRGRGIVQRAAWLCSNPAQRTKPGNVEKALELKLDRRGFIHVCAVVINTLLLLLLLLRLPLLETASMQGERHQARRLS